MPRPANPTRAYLSALRKAKRAMANACAAYDAIGDADRNSLRTEDRHKAMVIIERLTARAEAAAKSRPCERCEGYGVLTNGDRCPADGCDLGRVART